jgi:hypothetical protein
MTSIEERLRAGLVANTDHLMPDLDGELDLMYDRASRRQRMRRGAVVCAAAAAVAVTAWVVITPDPDGHVVPPVSPERSPIDLVGVRGALDPGTYSLAVWGNDGSAGSLPRVIVDVPEGYFSNGGWVIDPGSDFTDEAQQYGELSVWEVARVPADPCRQGTATTVGPTVADLARALVRQDGPSTRPERVVLDGHRGLTLELTMPPYLDPGDCTDGRYVLWQSTGGDTKDETHDGVVHRLWILDVDGSRLVVLVGLYPDQDPAQHDEQIAMAESLHFAPPGS